MEEHAATRKHDHLDDIHDTYDGCMIMLIIFTWVMCVCFHIQLMENAFCTTVQLLVGQSLLECIFHCIYLVRMACLARVGGRTPEVHATAAWRLHA